MTDVWKCAGCELTVRRETPSRGEGRLYYANRLGFVAYTTEARPTVWQGMDPDVEPETEPTEGLCEHCVYTCAQCDEPCTSAGDLYEETCGLPRGFHLPHHEMACSEDCLLVRELDLQRQALEIELFEDNEIEYLLSHSTFEFHMTQCGVEFDEHEADELLVKAGIRRYCVEEDCGDQLEKEDGERCQLCAAEREKDFSRVAPYVDGEVTAVFELAGGDSHVEYTNQYGLPDVKILARYDI